MPCFPDKYPLNRVLILNIRQEVSQILTMSVTELPFTNDVEYMDSLSLELSLEILLEIALRSNELYVSTIPEIKLECDGRNK